MKTIRRYFLFFLVNFLVLMSLSLLISFLGIRPFLQSRGLDLNSLLIFCLIWGIGGACISLALSRKMAKWMMGVKCIDPQTTSQKHSKLLTDVYSLAKRANLSIMPEVGVYDSQEINAFATGPGKKRSLVAVSSGLLNKLDDHQLEGVLAHEISHIANGDMITMTLLQGVINAFVMFLARILAYIVASQSRSRSRSGEGFSYMSFRLFTFLFEIVFLFFGSMAICLFSRQREFRADRDGASLVGKHKMIAALEALKMTADQKDAVFDKAAFNAFKISTPRKKGLLRTLFATHPPLEERIKRLHEF
jgi:heat shock protein HtpX